MRGVLKGGGLSSAFGGNIAVMDIYAAQHVFGRGPKFDRIDIALTEGVALETGEQAIAHRARAADFKCRHRRREGRVSTRCCAFTG